MTTAVLAVHVPGQPKVTLAWQETGVTTGYTYNVYRRDSAGVYDYTSPLTTGVTVLTYDDTTVVPGQTYAWEVTAVANGAESKVSNEVILAVPPLPTAPSNLTAVLS